MEDHELCGRLRYGFSAHGIGGADHRDMLRAADRIERLRAEVQSLRDDLQDERADNLWNAYNTGHTRAGRWTHMFMSDGEWLARTCGFDPKLPDYDDAEIRAAIPKAARGEIAPWRSTPTHKGEEG